MVTVYRGRDPLLLDATGEKVAPGGTQRVDMKYGAKIIQQFKGKIEGDKLTGAYTIEGFELPVTGSRKGTKPAAK